jgi:hypothetical protein
MQQFINMATSALGTSEQVARSVTGGLLDLIAKNAPQADVSALLQHLPGASDLINAFRAAPPPPPPPPPPDPGLLGSLTNAAALGTGSAMLGTGAAGLNNLASVLRGNGLDVSRAPQLIAMFAQFASQQAGPELVQRVLGAIPGMSPLLGTLGSLGVPGMPRK